MEKICDIKGKTAKETAENVAVFMVMASLDSFTSGFEDFHLKQITDTHYEIYFKGG